jgi:hypothetical protein
MKGIPKGVPFFIYDFLCEPPFISVNHCLTARKELSRKVSLRRTKSRKGEFQNKPA